MATKAERRAARERVSAYHESQLAGLLGYVGATLPDDHAQIGPIWRAANFEGHGCRGEHPSAVIIASLARCGGR